MAGPKASETAFVPHARYNNNNNNNNNNHIKARIDKMQQKADIGYVVIETKLSIP